MLCVLLHRFARGRMRRGHGVGAAGWIAASLVLLNCVALGAAGAASTSVTAAASEPTTVCASHILVLYWGAHGAKEVRTSPTSLAIAREALAKVLEPGADFEAVGGEFEKAYRDVGAYRTGPISRTSQMPREFKDVVFSLRPGEIADRVIYSDYGFHIIRRNPTVRCRQILISYQGASRSTVKHTREEAGQQAERVREEAARPGADFVALVRKYSDAPDVAKGGDVGVFDHGMMVAAFEKASFALKVGAIAPVVETRFGFHIIQRIE